MNKRKRLKMKAIFKHFKLIFLFNRKCVHKIILHQKIKKEVDKAKNDLNEKQKRLETAKKYLFF